MNEAERVAVIVEMVVQAIVSTLGAEMVGLICGTTQSRVVGGDPPRHNQRSHAVQAHTPGFLCLGPEGAKWRHRANEKFRFVQVGSPTSRGTRATARLHAHRRATFFDEETRESRVHREVLCVVEAARGSRGL